MLPCVTPVNEIFKKQWSENVVLSLHGRVKHRSRPGQALCGGKVKNSALRQGTTGGTVHLINSSLALPPPTAL